MLALVILIGLASLSLLMVAHELGHFFLARLYGVRVEEFGLGLPPRIFGVKRGETIYSVNAIPFGAFCKMAGEEDPAAPGSLAGKGRGSRLFILGGGALMNILLALVIMSIVFTVPADVQVGKVVVTEVAPDSPAAMAGIEPGDVILRVEDVPITNVSDLHREMLPRLGEKTVIVLGDGAPRPVQVVPRINPPEGQGALGITVDLQDATTVRQSLGFFEAVPRGLSEFWDTLAVYKNGMVSVFKGEAPADFVGPVGLVQITGEVAVQAGARSLLQAVALISFLLGVFNLLPLPAIDGGRIVFVLIELARRGKRISPKVEGIVHSIGFFLLILLLAVVTIQDIARLASGGSFVP